MLPWKLLYRIVKQREDFILNDDVDVKHDSMLWRYYENWIWQKCKEDIESL